MNELYSGLIGAIIGAFVGGVLSYLGSKKSTEKQIDFQSKKYEKEFKERRERYEEELEHRESIKKDKTKKSAGIILAEITSWIFQSVIITNNSEDRKEYYIKSIGSNSEYRRYLDNILEYLSLDEIHKIIEFYGCAQKINREMIQFNYTTGSENEIKHSCVALKRLVLTREKIESYQNMNFNQITRDSIIDNLKPEYKSILIKLKELSNIEIYI